MCSDEGVPCPKIELNTWRKIRNMSQNVINRPAEHQSGARKPRNEFGYGTAKDLYDEEMCKGTTYNRHRVQRFILQPIAVTLDKINYRAGSSATYEIIYLLHPEIFKRSGFERNTCSVNGVKNVCGATEF